MLRSFIAVSMLMWLFLLFGCVVHEYDPKNPKKYSDFWGDEEHRKGSPAYPFTNDSRNRDRSGPYGP